jgi:hypothetical protein
MSVRLTADDKVRTRDLPRLGMVGWYDPEQLLRTGLLVVVSTLFGKHSDSRLQHAISSLPPKLDYTDRKYLDDDGSFGFDYVADTGDGWNSTYAIAYMVSQPFCAPRNHAPLPRGKLLVLGGDLVYPYPTRERYEQRLIGPYTVAGQLLPTDGSHELLAIPGNHDWYDSLVNFRRIFCRGALVGSRTTQQTRSYFAARLPANWWLFGVDVQLDGDLDDPQAAFFDSVIDKLTDQDRVVLCLPEPMWLCRWEDSKGARSVHVPRVLDLLARRVEDKVPLYVAGDLHHYQRHSDGQDRHLVTCGMGGAFLHPTHKTASDPSGEFTHQKSFPDKRTSFWLTFLNLRFITRNPLFGVVPAVAYLLAAWQNGLAVGEHFGSGVVIQEMGRLGLSRWWEAFVAGFHSALLNPIGIALYAIIFSGFVFFSDRSSRRFRYTVGTLHACAHVAAGFLLYWLGVYIAITYFDLTPKSVLQYLLTGTIIFISSWIVGSILLGLYLIVSLNVFGRHQNEAFSSLRIQNWKGFLRFRIDKDGALTMRFIGFKKVPRWWRVQPLDGEREIWAPAKGQQFEAEVIDEIRIPARPATASSTTMQ